MGNIQLKVLQVGPKNYPPDHGGVEKVVYDLATNMSELESRVFTEWEPANTNPNVEKLSKNLLSAWKQARKYCRKNDIDIVHLHKETFIPLGLLLKLTGRRCILTVHGCAWRLKRWPIYTRILLFLLDCLSCCFLDRTVFVGERDWRLFKRVIFFRKLYLIRNGVAIREECNSPGKDGMAYLGRISPEKNILNLIRAVESAKVRLDLYGPFDRHDGKFRERVLHEIQTSNYAKWKGAVPFDRVRSTLSSYRFFVNPSFSEGLPVSVLEAATEGLHLVLSDIPQHRLLGFPACTYVDPHNLKLSKEVLNGELGHANREHVQKFFGLENMVEAYRNIYKELS